MKRVEDIKPDERDLPWANDYLDRSGEAGDVTRVKQIIPGRKGFTVIGETFKGFIFEGSKLHQFIYDAIPYWVEHPSLPFGLYIEVLENGKITLCTEDAEACTIVASNKKKNIEVKWAKESESGLDQSVLLNPFIPQSPSPTPASNQRKGKNSPTEPLTKL